VCFHEVAAPSRLYLQRSRVEGSSALVRGCGSGLLSGVSTHIVRSLGCRLRMRPHWGDWGVVTITNMQFPSPAHAMDPVSIKIHHLPRTSKPTSTSASPHMARDANLSQALPNAKSDPHARDDASSKSSSVWPVIATKDQIPEWLRDNDYILLGHPMPTQSYALSFRSGAASTWRP
jgi:hypothetical protein